MSRKRDSSTVAAVANYIDHSYADQSPKTEDEATAAPTPPPCEPASSTSSPSSYVNSDHSYHVSTSKSTKQSRAAAAAAAGSNGPKSKKARKSTRLASTRASSTTRTAAAASTGKTTVNDANRKGNDERNVASTVDQVTSSSTVASPHTQQQSPSPSPSPAAIIPSFGDDATLSNGLIATQMSQQKPNIIPSLLTTKTETTTEHNPIQSVKSHNHARVNQMPVPQPVTQRSSSSSGGGGGGHQMVNAMDEAFGRFVVSCLRGMSPTRRNNARHQIMQVLNECIDYNNQL